MMALVHHSRRQTPMDKEHSAIHNISQAAVVLHNQADFQAINHTGLFMVPQILDINPDLELTTVQASQLL